MSMTFGLATYAKKAERNGRYGPAKDAMGVWDPLRTIATMGFCLYVRLILRNMRKSWCRYFSSRSSPSRDGYVW